MEHLSLRINGQHAQHGLVIEVVSQLALDVGGVEALLRQRLAKRMAAKGASTGWAVELTDKNALNGSRFLVLLHPDIGIMPVKEELAAISAQITAVLDHDTVLALLKPEEGD